MKKIPADYFTCKKFKVNFFLSCMVITMHLSTFANYDLANPVGNGLLFYQSLIVTLNQAIISTFMLMSGAMFFRNYELKDTLKKYKSRVKSILIPYLIWNLIWTLFQYFCSYTFVSKLFVGRELTAFSIEDLLRGVILSKYTPFWFIGFLFVFVLASPIFYIMIKNKYLGAFSVVAVFSLFVFFDQNDFYRLVPVHRFDVLVYYILGAYIGRHFFNSFSERKSPKISLLAIAIVILGIYILRTKYYDGRVYDSQLHNHVYIFIMCCMAWAFWRIPDLFNFTFFRQYETESFFIYLTHGNISSVITKVLYWILPKATMVSFFNFYLSTAATVAVICTVGVWMSKHTPKLKKIIAGGR